MAELFDMIDTHWSLIEPVLPSPFTTQDLQEAVQRIGPQTWEELTRRYGPGGRGSGNFYSPANILFNYLENKERRGLVHRNGFVPSRQGWGTKRVAAWVMVAATPPPPTEDDLQFAEGKPEWRLHLSRERARGLREALLTSRRQSGQGLSCEMCGTKGDPLDEDIRDALFEAHHSKRPFAGSGEGAVKVSEMALLCACCHRLLHRLISRHGAWLTPREGQIRLGLARNAPGSSGQTTNRTV